MIWIAAVGFVCFAICMPLFMFYKIRGRLVLASSFKVLGTLCAFVMSLIAAIRLDPRCYICAAALFLHAGADYVIEFNLMLGAGLFLCGHICYIAFFLGLFPATVSHLFIFLLLLCFMVVVFFRWRKPMGKSLPLFAVYGAVLSLMCTCALNCFFMNILSGILIALGGAFFYFSDTMLLKRLLFPSDRLLSWVVMITYYLAQFLIGLSCLQL